MKNSLNLNVDIKEQLQNNCQRYHWRWLIALMPGLYIEPSGRWAVAGRLICPAADTTFLLSQCRQSHSPSSEWTLLPCQVDRWVQFILKSSWRLFSDSRYLGTVIPHRFIHKRKRQRKVYIFEETASAAAGESVAISVTRLGNLLDFGQLFTALSNN